VEHASRASRPGDPLAVPDRPTRVLIADDDPMMIEALADLVASRPFLLLVGVAADGEQAIAIACRERPDVALLDVRMPGGGPETARGIRACSPGTAIVALSAYRDRESMEGMRDAGTREYLVKGSATIDAIVSAIRGAAATSTLPRPGEGEPGG
jgi:DNA-binding NarL/FixJ family response regulator